MEVERTLALIKPDAVKAGKAQEIKQLLEIHGFTIIAEQKLQLTKLRAEEFYREHLGKPFFPKLTEFMTSGPIWAMVLSKVDAIKEWRNLMGPTNVFTARETAPRSLRALYGTDGTQNATHGSDSPSSAVREIKFFFPAMTLEPLHDNVSAKVYISSHLQPALSKALTALARQKPTAEKFEAITFLADFLLNNNPNKPKIVLPDAWDPSAEQEDEEADFAHAHLANLATVAAARAAQQEAAAAAAAEAASSHVVAEAASSPVPVDSHVEAAHTTQDAPRAVTQAEPHSRAATPPTVVDAPVHSSADEPAAPSAQESQPEAVDVAPTESAPAAAPASRPRSAALEPASDNATDAQELNSAPPQAPTPSDEELPVLADFTDEQVAAVTKIQAAGRGMLDRKRVHAMRVETGSPGQQQEDAQLNGEATEAGAVEAEPQADVPKEEEGGNQVEAVSAAAPVEESPVEASPAGDAAAEAIPVAEDVPSTAEAQPPAEGAEQAEEEELPVLADFTDEQVAAVTKIQAAGRGMLDRKRVHAMKTDATSGKNSTDDNPVGDAGPTEGGEEAEASPAETAATESEAAVVALEAEVAEAAAEAEVAEAAAEAEVAEAAAEAEVAEATAEAEVAEAAAEAEVAEAAAEAEVAEAAAEAEVAEAAAEAEEPAASESGAAVETAVADAGEQSTEEAAVAVTEQPPAEQEQAAAEDEQPVAEEAAAKDEQPATEADEQAASVEELPGAEEPAPAVEQEPAAAEDEVAASDVAAPAEPAAQEEEAPQDEQASDEAIAQEEPAADEAGPAAADEPAEESAPPAETQDGVADEEPSTAAEEA